MPTVFERILNKIGLMPIGQAEAMTKKSSEWGKLWSVAQEYKLFGDKVTNPYENISAVYMAIKAIADNVPQADLKFYKDNGKELLDDPIVRLFNKPNPFMTESDLIQAWVGFHSLYGEVFIIKVKSVGQAIGSNKLPAELWAFNPRKFEAVMREGIPVGWKYAGQKDMVFPLDEIIHTKDFNPYNIFRGVAPTKPIEKIMDIDWQSLIFNKAFFENDATPGMALTTDKSLNDTQVKRLREQWMQRHQGANNAFKVAILEAGLKPANITPTHKDMDFIEQKKFTREQMLGIWRVPKALFNITEDLNYATFIGQMKIFWNYAIMPMLNKIESSIDTNIVQPYNPNITVKFDISNVVAYQEDFKEKITTAQQLFAMGFTGNEINKKLQLGFDDQPWRDKWWIPFGMTPAGEETLPPAPAADPDTGKALDKSFDSTRYMAIWKTFIAKQAPLEDKFAKKISKYFFEQRVQALKGLEESRGKDVNINWGEEKKILKEKAKPFLLQAIREGVSFGREFLGKSLSDETLEQRLMAYLSVRADRITMITDTVMEEIIAELEIGIGEGEAVRTMAERILAIKDIYNMAASRAMLIARTETIGAMNGGSLLYYQASGITEKKWITARDAEVRLSHRMLEGQTKNLDERFGNGLMYPGDQDGDASEICNCRCTLIPVINV